MFYNTRMDTESISLTIPPNFDPWIDNDPIDPIDPFDGRQIHLTPRHSSESEHKLQAFHARPSSSAKKVPAIYPANVLGDICK